MKEGLTENKRGLRFALPVALVWASLLAVDWGARVLVNQEPRRFHRFGRPAQPYAPMTTYRYAGGYGEADFSGDLTRMLRVPSLVRQYRERRGEIVFETDEFGFQNTPPVAGRKYEIVVTGDSFVNRGDRSESTIAGVLERASARAVYNQGWPAAGAFTGLRAFLHDPRFRDSPPRWVVWGFIERDMSAAHFARVDAELDARHGPAGWWESPRWALLVPANLQEYLRRYSYVQKYAMVLRSWIDWRFRGRVSDLVAIAPQGCLGRPFLFYGPELERFERPPGDADRDAIVAACRAVQARLRERGSELLVLLVPDKCNVYRECLRGLLDPAAIARPDADAFLTRLAGELAAAGVPAVNLLLPFRERALAGEQLYWSDDTHWNDAGIAVAGELVAARLGELEGRASEGRKSARLPVALALEN